MARVDIEVGRVIEIANEPVVIGQLFAFADCADRIDVDPAMFDRDLTISVARVVDETREAAAHASVDHQVLVDLEEEGVTVVVRAILVATVRLGLRDALAGVLDDSRAFRDGATREHPGAVDARTLALDGVDRKGRGGLRARLGAGLGGRERGVGHDFFSMVVAAARGRSETKLDRAAAVQIAAVATSRTTKKLASVLAAVAFARILSAMVPAMATLALAV